MTPSIERVVPALLRSDAVRRYSLLRFYVLRSNVNVVAQLVSSSASGERRRRDGTPRPDELGDTEPRLQADISNTPIVSEKQTGMCRPHCLLVFDAVIFLFLFVPSTCLQ